MPDKSGRLNRQEQTFVTTYVGTGDPTYSATKAGYASPQPRGAQNLAKPGIQLEIRKQQFARLHNRLLPLAFDHFEKVLTDPDSPIRDRTMVAKVITEVCRNLGEDSVP